MITLKHDLPPPISDPNDLLRSGNCISFQWYIGFSVVVHNHPSGDPTPSQADIQMTKAIIDIAAPLGISVHDHIIVGKNGHASLKGMRLL